MGLKSQNVILFSTADWDNPFWTNKQHTAKHLAERGYKVLYIESLGLRQPQLKSADLSRIFARIGKFFKGARLVQDRLWVYSPLVIPFHRFAFVRALNQWLLVRVLKRLQRQLGLDRALIWTYNPMVLGLARELDRSKIIYHSVDDLTAAPGIDAPAVRAAEDELLRHVDLVFCTSRKIGERCRVIAGDRVHEFTNVVDYQHFVKARAPLAEPLDVHSIPQPRIGFVGALSSYKVDVDAIREVARARPDWHWVMIGKVGEGQPDSTMVSLDQEPNVHFLGPKAYADLPQYLRSFNVATIPCPLNDYTQSMFPMKFFEYMAAGKPIVARRIDSLKAFEQNFFAYNTAREMRTQLELAIKSGVEHPEQNDRLAQEHTWDRRLSQMLALMS